jgi:hypothetical protein
VSAIPPLRHKGTYMGAKILFLDIDGVLNTWYSMTRGYCPDRHLHYFQKSCVKELNRITKATGANIVVSSTWRKHRDWLGVIQHMHQEGVEGTIIGKTGVSDDGYRGNEIMEWVGRKTSHCDSFVILDDDSDMLPYMDRLVQTSMDGGLRRHHADQAIKILKEKTCHLTK